jgi:hypothetical protein
LQIGLIYHTILVTTQIVSKWILGAFIVYQTILQILLKTIFVENFLLDMGIRNPHTYYSHIAGLAKIISKDPCRIDLEIIDLNSCIKRKSISKKI